MDARPLQYQTADGTWLDVLAEDRDRVIAQAVRESARRHDFRPEAFPVALDRDGVLAALQAGKKVGIGQDWHAHIRLKPEPVPAPPPDTRQRLRCRECGQYGLVGQYPFSTLPAWARICDDCA